MNSREVAGVLGFPPPLLGPRPVRLRILGRGDGWIALEKPAGIAVRQHPWDLAFPDLDHALNAQLGAGKPELVRLGAAVFASAFHLDPEISGCGFFATSEEGVDRFRNAVGSMRASFSFLFSVPHGEHAAGSEFACDAPLVPHHSLAKVVPSTARGKRSRTVFRCLGRTQSGWTLWNASADLLRPHQVRAHAALSGIGVPGDAVYGGVPIPSAREVFPRMKGPGAGRPIFRQMPLHLSRFTLDGEGVAVDVPLPEALAAAVRRLGLDADIAGG